MSTLLTVLTSAAVGVLVSSFITFLGQVLERRARQNELLLVKAMEMAKRKTEISLEVAKISNRNVTIRDECVNAETYLHWLKSLLKTGKLPPDAEKFKGPSAT